MELTPLHYADAIVRSEIPVNAIGIQLNVGILAPGLAAARPATAEPTDRTLDRIRLHWS